MISSKVATIDEYISGFPKPVQAILKEIRQTIKKAAPEAGEKIGYGMPTFTLNGNLIHFAAYEHHIGLYPAPSGIEAFQKELSIYKSGKGSIQFPLDQPVPFALITKIVKYRVKEQMQKKKK